MYRMSMVTSKNLFARGPAAALPVSKGSPPPAPSPRPTRGRRAAPKS